MFRSLSLVELSRPKVDGIAGLRAVASAPGKVILFGEHAVVYGHPAIAAATDQRTVVEVHCCGDKFTVNGFKIHEKYHSYLLKAVDEVWTKPEPVRIQTEGGVPSASGTGSSAALTVACVAGLLRLQDRHELADIAQQSFHVERATQGGGSPTDTSVSTAGGGIAIAGGDYMGLGDQLWQCQWEEATWSVERVKIPEMTVVVGNSGVKSKTDEQVAKVAHAMERNPIVRDTLGDLGRIARDAVPALAAADWEKIGRLVDQSHSALHTIGVNHEAVQKLVEAARATPGTLGAKITGAGGGGSMFGITERPHRLARAIEEAGGTPFIVKLGGAGVEFDEE